MKWLRMKSIKSKIAIVFSLAFLIMLVTLILINQFFMDGFYIISNKAKMTEAAMEFEKSVREEGSRKAFDEISIKIGCQVFVFNGKNKSIPRAFENKPINLILHEIDRLKESAQSKNNGIHFEVLRNGDSNDSLLTVIKILESGDVLILIKQMGLAKEASILNFQFMLITSIFIYGIALILIFVISSKFSKPVIEMKNKTEKMSQLDFSQKIDVLSIDEVGMLSISINRLSDELSNTIGQLNNTNKKLNIELEKEKKLEKMRRRFVSDVSHELKNPISMIQGFADGLMHNIPKTEEDKAYYYQVIVEESVKMNRLIKDLLDLSSYESGSFTLNKEIVDLAQIVKDNVEKFGEKINNQGLNVIFECSGQYLVFGDGLRLGQVVINLLTNALKYVNEKGTIMIKLSKSEDKVILTIGNTGDLIPEKELDQIWNSFYQIDNTKKGNGLGLAIVKSIVTLHNGSCKAYINDNFNFFEVVI